MKKIIFIFVLLFAVDASAEVFNKKCISQKTGASTFNINLDTVILRGVLGYEFMGQKITYEISKGKFSNSIFTGIAAFLSSETGETHGKPFMITYDAKKNILTETNIIYVCN